MIWIFDGFCVEKKLYLEILENINIFLQDKYKNPYLLFVKKDFNKEHTDFSEGIAFPELCSVIKEKLRNQVFALKSNEARLSYYKLKGSVTLTPRNTLKN
jgi:hypothetical protein